MVDMQDRVKQVFEENVKLKKEVPAPYPIHTPMLI